MGRGWNYLNLETQSPTEWKFRCVRRGYCLVVLVSLRQDEEPHFAGTWNSKEGVLESEGYSEAILRLLGKLQRRIGCWYWNKPATAGVKKFC